MLQTFLEERFRLKIHHEMREMPLYAMSIAKGGLKVLPLAEGACRPIDLTPATAAESGRSPAQHLRDDDDGSNW